MNFPDEGIETTNNKESILSNNPETNDAISGLLACNDPILASGTKTPKKNVLQLWESESLMTPGIFDFSGLLERISNGESIIIRSESLDEYNGPSGICDSIIITKNSITSQKEEFETKFNLKANTENFNSKKDELLKEIDDLFKFKMNIYCYILLALNFKTINEEVLRGLLLKFSDLGGTSAFGQRNKIKTYCEYTGKSEEEYKRKISFSYMQYIEGINLKVIADSHIHGKYYIQAFSKKEEVEILIISHNGVINIHTPFQKSSYDDVENIIIGKVPSIIEEYEKAKQILDSQSHYSIEMQLETPIFPSFNPDDSISDEGFQTYLLQAHKLPDHKREFHVLDIQKTTELEAQGYEKTIFVRGATGVEGITSKKLSIPNNPVKAEVVLRKIPALIVPYTDDIGMLIACSTKGHEEFSTIYKPGIFIVLGKNTSKQLKTLDDPVIHIISDGDTCFTRIK